MQTTCRWCGDRMEITRARSREKSREISGPRPDDAHQGEDQVGDYLLHSCSNQAPCLVDRQLRHGGMRTGREIMPLPRREPSGHEWEGMPSWRMVRASRTTHAPDQDEYGQRRSGRRGYRGLRPDL